MRTLVLLALLLAFLTPLHAQSWEPLPDLLAPVSGALCGAPGGDLLCLGGLVAGEGGALQPCGTVSLLSTGDTAWRPTGPLPFGLVEACAATVGDRLFVMSGTDGRRALADTLICVRWRRTRQWLHGPDLPEPRLQAAAAVIGKMVYLSGGAPGTGLAGKLSNGLLRLDTGAQTPAWEALRRMPGSGRAQHAMVACGGKLYVFGGVTRDGDALVPSDDALMYDPARNRWERLPDLPDAIRQAAAVEHGGQILILGGRHLPPAAAGIPEHISDLVLSFDPATRTYAEAGKLPAPLAGLAATRLPNGALALAGGEGPEGALSAAALRLSLP